MDQKFRSQAEQELTALIHRFDHWRQTRVTRREPIPDPLWEQAISLTSDLPLSRVAKRLRLNRQELKRRCAAAMAVASPVLAEPPPPDFIEVNAASSWLETASVMELEMERADGTRLRLAYREAQPPVVALVRAFLETTR